MFKKFNKALLVAALIGGIMSGNCSDDRGGSPQPILSMRQINSYGELARNGKIDQKYIVDCIDKTNSYFGTVQKPEEVSFDESEWRKSQLVYTLNNIRGSFASDLTIAPKCYELIISICGKSNYQLSRYLIMSQCKKWEESSNCYELIQKKDLATAYTAINMLQSATNGDTTNAKKLLESLTESGVFAPKLKKAQK